MRNLKGPNRFFSLPRARTVPPVSGRCGVRAQELRGRWNRSSALPCLALAALLLTTCGGQSTGSDVSIDRSLTFDEIDQEIYLPGAGTNDPFAEIYAGFRENRAEAMADPEMPPPIEPYETVHRSAERPWDTLESALPFDWQQLDRLVPAQAQQLRAALRLKRVFDHPDLKIVQLMLAPGAVLPAHAGGSPGVFLVIGGEAEVTVGSETYGVTPGSKIKLEPYVERAVAVDPGEPLRVLWIRWAPNGDHRYIQAGYYLTGNNQHVQAVQAKIPDDYEFWGQRNSIEKIEQVTHAAVAKGSGSSSVGLAEFLKGQRDQLEAQRTALGPDALTLYPAVATFGHESDNPWLDEEAIRNSNFMWAKDVLSTGALLERWAEVVRMEGIFQARHEDGTWDFNISQQAWGSGARYVEHSHSIPEFYYMLSGEVEHWNGDTAYEASPGDVFMTNSFQTHQSRVKPKGEIWRSYGSTWAPNGDRSVFERPFFLVGQLVGQPETAVLPEDLPFHE